MAAKRFRSRSLGRFLLFAFLLSGCPANPITPPPPPPEDGGTNGDRCGDFRATSAIHNGTADPTLLPLEAGQAFAIGYLPMGPCSAIFVHEEWALTARHCRLAAGGEVCVGEPPARPDICIPVEEVIDHPTLDLSIFRIEGRVTDHLDTVVPIPILTQDLGLFAGQLAEAAGYGLQEDGRRFGEREFVPEMIVDFEGGWVTVIAGGDRGVCNGDSGGPLMVIDENGEVRVAGVLDQGAEDNDDCRGRDHYTRTDRIAGWIQDYIGPVQSVTGGCAGVDEIGRCFGSQAYWCEEGRIRTARCPVRCGWNGSRNAFRCLESDDPCEGIDGFGICDGETARWCEAGELKARACGSCAQSCVRNHAGANCVVIP